MPISVNPVTKVITIPQADLTPLGGALYELDVNAFRLALKDWEDSEEGMVHLPTHRHSTETTLSGVVYARIFEIINGYTVTFQDGQYTVRCAGANHNLGDVKNVNSVSLILGNSAGLITVNTGGTVAPTQQQIRDAMKLAPSAGSPAADSLDDKVAKLGLLEKLLRNKTVTDPVTGVMTVYDDDGVSVLFTANLYEGTSTAQPYRGQGAERRERLA